MNSWPGSSSSSRPSSSGSSSGSLRKKTRFFRRLQSPFEEDDDDLDDKELELRRRSRAFFPRPGKPVQEPESHSPCSQEIAVAATPRATTPANSEIIKGTPLHTFDPRRRTASADTSTSFVEETPPPPADAPAARRVPAPTSAAKLMLRRSTTAPPQATAAAPSTARVIRSVSAHSQSVTEPGKKRKRTATARGGEELAPEERRIFRDLAFFYIPDSDIAPVRRIRMAKAQKYGARRVHSAAEATHVIVDKELEYKDIEPLVGAFLAPDAANALVIVNETFPGDCLQFGVLLNPFQYKYLIKGCPRATVQPASSTGASPQESPSSSQHSLQLKPPAPNKRSRKIYRRSSTPPREEPAAASPTHDDDLAKTSEEEDVIIPSSQEIPEYENNTASFQHDKAQEAKTWSRENEPKDELSNYIEMMARYKDLPLDSQEDEDDVFPARDSEPATPDREGSEDGNGSEDERSNHHKTRGGRKTTATWEDGFACNHGGTKDNKTASVAANPNARTIEVLQSMCDFYERTNDHWRTTAYRKAIGTLRRTTDRRIATESEAARLPGVGPRLASKIEEIATTDRLRRLENARAEPLDAVLQIFLGVYGAGLTQAHKWISQGFRTLDDLTSRARLTPAQRMGVERYADLNSRIPRAEVEALGDLVRREAALVDPDLGVVVATVAALRTDRPGGSKWHGCCVLPQADSNNTDNVPPSVWRRVDFLLVPETEYGAALIYFTGNDIFNRSMRLLASKKGMRLNQRGLYRNVLRGPNRAKITTGELVEGRDERKIFEILGVKWREPWERWC
ncbi:hypothetical protein MAPG_03105 [Magnaporthiopsis poae ATCC 64411]|uniref:DNA-directed DNA polymerase n=1 Tax=Magnaporthiopsis poae (strain ATCC 64411 / 73-15) TaxID=644358 RepID=A0A0C4DT48_MAGP6|nr:hypothetical protein MAPG_03105 [Magnaporthiopsis poae ATCC 64411]